MCIMLAVRLPKGLEKRLDKLAKSTGRTKSFYVRQALEENFDDIEDSKLADKNLGVYRSRRAGLHPRRSQENARDVAVCPSMVGYPILSKVTTAIRTCLTAKD